MSAAIVAAVVVAGGAAYAANKQAGAAKDAAKQGSKTNSTSTSSPYLSGQLQPGIDSILAGQAQQYANGPNYVGSGQPLYPGGPPTGSKSSSSAGGGGAVPAGYHRNAKGQVVPVKNGANAVAAPTATGSGGTNFNDPKSISAEVAKAGLNAGHDPATMASQNAVQNMLGGLGQNGGNVSGNGFENYNPINSYLANNLQGQMQGDDSNDLIHQFLGADGQVHDGGSAGGGGGAAGGGGGSNQWAGYSGSGATQGQNAYASGGGGGGGPQDSTAGGGLYNDTVKRLLAQGVDKADIQTMVDSQNADIAQQMQTAMWGTSAQAQGTGRFGGDTYKGLMNDQAHQAEQAMYSADASTRMQGLQAWQSFQDSLLGQVNNRDIATMNDATNRAGISASSAASAQASQNAYNLGMRGQNLNALGMLQQGGQFATSQLGGLGQELSSNQLAAINSSPGLAGVANAGLGQANNAAGNDVSQLNAQAAANAQIRSSQIGASVARSGQALQAQMFNANQGQDALNSYLNTLRGIGGMGGTQTSQGTNALPYSGSPTGAAVTAGIGGAITGYGLYNQYQANQASQGYNVAGTGYTGGQAGNIW